MLKARAASLTCDLNRDANRPVLHHADLRWSGHIFARSSLLLFPIHVPGRPLYGVVVGKGKPRRGSKQLVVSVLVKDGRDVAVRVQSDAIVVVFKLVLRRAQRRALRGSSPWRDMVDRVAHRGHARSKQDGAVLRELRGHLCPIRSSHSNTLPPRARSKRNLCGDDIRTLNVERVVDDNRNAVA